MIRRLALVMFFSSLLSRAAEPADRLTAAGISEFTAAFQTWDGKRFRAAADLCRQATRIAAASMTNFYWLGVAQFHCLLHYQTLPDTRSNQLAASGAMDAALAALNHAVQLDPRHAESHALLGTLYGMKIGGNLIRGLRFGPRVAKHRKVALESGAGNPRVLYLLGTCQFHTAKKPAEFREALASFLGADKLFETESRRTAAPLEPRWGRSSCHTFIGRTYESLGERTKAAEYFRKALAEHPADHLAREGLVRVTETK